MINRRFVLICFLATLSLNFAHAADKPKLTLDDFFNYVDILAVAISPDGNSVVINTERADWGANKFRRELWLYRDDGHGGGTLAPLTQAGDDTAPQWSPDGRWIAFLSERKAGNDDTSDSKEVAQLYIISLGGGEPFAVTRGDEEVHSFSWSPDARTLYFATRTPWTKAQKDAYKKEWKDVLQYRAAERGDTIFSLDVTEAIARRATEGSKPDSDSEDEAGATPGSHPLASTPWRVHELEASPDGHKLAFVTESVSEREEKVEEFEIYSVELAQASLEQPPRQLTHDEAVEQDLHWGKDSKHIFFEVQYGSVEGKYKDTQTRLYWIDADSGEIQRWAADFTGANWGTTIPVLTMSIFLEDFPGMCRSAIRKKPPSIK
jgi:dipeptidyl aminopeptidase/acylaminoacyl peptidase